MFSHFISCNVKESLSLIYHLFENLKFKHDDGNIFATKLWMKEFVGLNNDENQWTVIIFRILPLLPFCLRKSCSCFSTPLLPLSILSKYIGNDQIGEVAEACRVYIRFLNGIGVGPT